METQYIDEIRHLSDLRSAMNWRDIECIEKIVKLFSMYGWTLLKMHECYEIESMSKPVIFTLGFSKGPHGYFEGDYSIRLPFDFYNGEGI